ncbi:protein translocase subunit SecF [Salinirubellus salinus]|uniref:Protein-export membrane protein SecF n=1 Tax=Salinirubellus salinus TaxID=1364945 RepID=A0A9E7UCY8_9EURY|nr:protein translocase subunit SecF [Salinirubellus salinus]UWM56792.1 protein translocase subunit SecF [Salinirubellus salinus]
MAEARAQLPFNLPEVDYERYSNRQLVAIPVTVLGLALLVIAVFFALNGTPVGLGIEFTGGTELQVTTDQSEAQIRQAFDAEIASFQPIAAQENAYIITFQSEDTNAIEQQAIAAFGEGSVDSVVGREGSFGRQAQTQALGGIAVAFVGMSILVFALFRTFVPSIAVVLSAFSDIVIPLALMNLFGIELSLGTVAALLMLIGYSVDSDLLLNNHVLRRRGGFYESTYRAMRTGVTMTLTSISAMTVMTIVAFLFGIPLLPSIGLILVFGLTADLMNTYMLNVTLLRYYKFEAIGR